MDSKLKGAQGYAHVRVGLGRTRATQEHRVGGKSWKTEEDKEVTRGNVELTFGAAVLSQFKYLSRGRQNISEAPLALAAPAARHVKSVITTSRSP